jgi:predicted nucleic acid-binding Zn ribbon protein
VIVDNSPWLQELTLREGELLARLQARYGTAAIKALHLRLVTP